MAAKKDDPKVLFVPTDLSQPHWVTYYQTPKRQYMELWTSEDAAVRHASNVALQHKRSVAVFGPQALVKVPPSAPVADNMKLEF